MEGIVNRLMELQGGQLLTPLAMFAVLVQTAFQIEWQNPKLQIRAEVESRQRLRKASVLRIDECHLPRPTQVALSVGKHLVEVGLLEPVLLPRAASRRVQYFPLRIQDTQFIAPA